jgi:hypothetical protein
MTRKDAILRASEEAKRIGKPMAVLIRNPFSVDAYVVQGWDDGLDPEQVALKVPPVAASGNDREM